jgi:hypothetical protein
VIAQQSKDSNLTERNSNPGRISPAQEWKSCAVVNALLVQFPKILTGVVIVVDRGKEALSSSKQKLIN